jgi:sarcosine oxidase, subunit delta
MKRLLPVLSIEDADMMQIPCPSCGPRDEDEFTYGGDANPVRPSPADAVTDEEWERYLFHYDTSKGLKTERWLHSFGCRRWFNIQRNTLTHEVMSKAT